MRLSWITSAALTMGVSAMVPTLAMADNRHDDNHGRVEQRDVRHDDHRDVRIENRNVRVEHEVRVDRDVHIRPEIRVERDVRIVPEVRYIAPAVTYVAPEACPIPADFDTTISLNQVPGFILDQAERISGNGRIDGAQYVQRDGKLFYRLQIAGRTEQNYRFTPDGALLSVEAVG